MGSKYDTPHDQFIIAYLPNPERSEVVMSHALPLAQMLNKGLILLYIEDPRYGGMTCAEASELLKAEVQRIKPQHNDTNYAALRGKTKEIIAALPMLLYGVVVVAESQNNAPRRNATHPREVLHNFAESKIAYLVAQKELQSKSAKGYMPNVALSIDYSRESKEKLIWASYFARFGKSQLHILSHAYRDERLNKLWSDNIRFMQKIFSSLAITNYLQEKYISHGVFTEPCALEHAANKGYDMLISVTTDMRDRDTLELIIGTAEQRTIRNKQQLPILFLNPRDDLFVLCD